MTRGVPALVGLLFVVSAAIAAADVELRGYQIEQREIAVPPPQEPPSGDYHRFSNAVRLRGLADSINLGRSGTDGEERFGFDPTTLRLRWLDPQRVLLLEWRTPYLGSGGYIKQGMLVVEIEGDRVRREIFRDSIYFHAKSGMVDWSDFELGAAFHPATRILTLTRVDNAGMTSEEKSLFDDGEFTDGRGKVMYHSETTERRVWVYELEEQGLRLLSSERYVDLGKRVLPIGAVAAAFGLSADDLVHLDPTLKGRKTLTGAVRISDTLEPYKLENDDGICETPCP